MIVLEGMMMVPPERGTIMGRNLWKVRLKFRPYGCCRIIPLTSFLQPRYVVLGTGSPLKLSNEQADCAGRTAIRKGGLKGTSAKPSLVDVSQPEPLGNKLYITIYKAKVHTESPSHVNV